MILTNRLFDREAPSREAKSLYIFCEGVKREYQYFRYFKEMDSRINVEIYKLDTHEDNSPLGLLNIAKKSIIASEDNTKPKYSFLENDEVWIVLDTDKDKGESRKSQIDKVRNFCIQKGGWFLAQSNPCFEVWLYYHHASEKPVFEDEDSECCNSWKNLVNDSIAGGFDSRRHPLYIEKATLNAEKTFDSAHDILTVGTTEVFRLSKSMLPLIKSKLKAILQTLN